MFNGDRAANRCWSITASACRQRWTTGRCVRGVRKHLAATCCSCRATPGSVRARSLRGEVVEQIIRPTGLVDPPIEVRPGPRPGARPAPADSGAGGHRRTRAGDHADQAAGGGSFAASSRRRACVGNTCTAKSTRWSGWRFSSAASGAFDVLVGVNLLREGSTCRRCRWLRSSTRTRRVSCAARLR
jgi:hypothetical protein